MRPSRAYLEIFSKEDLDFSFEVIFLWKEAGRGAEAQSVAVNMTGCGFDPHSSK